MQFFTTLAAAASASFFSVITVMIICGDILGASVRQELGLTDWLTAALYIVGIYIYEDII